MRGCTKPPGILWVLGVHCSSEGDMLRAKHTQRAARSLHGNHWGNRCALKKKNSLAPGCCFLSTNQASRYFKQAVHAITQTNVIVVHSHFVSMDCYLRLHRLLFSSFSSLSSLQTMFEGRISQYCHHIPIIFPKGNYVISYHIPILPPILPSYPHILLVKYYPYIIISPSYSPFRYGSMISP